MATSDRPKRAYRRKTAASAAAPPVKAAATPVRAKKPSEKAQQAAKRLRNALNDKRFDGIEDATDLEGLLAVTKECLIAKSDDVRDFHTNGKLDNALRIGAAWRYGQQRGWISKGNTEETAKKLPYSYSHIRRFGQLFDAFAEDILLPALQWMSDVRNSLTFQMQKSSGIDHALESVKEFKKYSAAITKGSSEDEAIEILNEAHKPKEREVKLAPWQIQNRMETLLFYSTAGDSVMLEKLIPDYAEKTHDMVVEWAKTAPWRDDDQKAWDDVQEKSGMVIGPKTTSNTRRSGSAKLKRLTGPRNKPVARKAEMWGRPSPKPIRGKDQAA